MDEGAPNDHIYNYASGAVRHGGIGIPIQARPDRNMISIDERRDKRSMGSIRHCKHGSTV